MLCARPPNRPWQVAQKNTDRDLQGHPLRPPALAGYGRTPRWWVSVQRPVWPAGVVVIGVLAGDDPQVPFTDDQQLIRAFAAGEPVGLDYWIRPG